MQDRFQELYDNSTSQSGFNEAEMIDVPIEAQRLEVPAGLENFNARVEQLKLDISQLRNNVETLNTSYRSMLVAMDSAKMQEEVIDPLETKIESSLKAISNELKNMHEENQVAREHGKWRSNVHSLLTKQFMDVLLQFRRIQSDYHDKVQERVRQRIMIVNPDATPQEIQQAVDTGNLNVFGQQLMDTTAAKDALTYVEGRHREILRIEERVNEIHKLFSDMAAMVNAQGEFIDDIEANVARAGEYVQEANKDLAGALKRKKRNRRCAFICCVISIILIVVAIITLLLVGNNIGWFKKAAI